MAEFGIQATELSAPQGAGTSVLQPATTMPLDNGVAENISGFLNIFQKGLELDKKSKAEALKGSIIKDYSRQQQSINDAIESGGLAGDAAVRRSRILFNKFMGSYPELEKELSSVATAFKGFSQIGEAQERIKTEADMRNDLIKKAQSSGAMPVDPNMGKDAQDAYIRNFQAQEQADATFRRLNAKEEANRASGRYSREVADIERKNSSLTLLNDLANNNIDMFFSAADDYRMRIQNGELNPQQAALSLNQQFTKVEQSINGIAGLNPELASMYRGLFDETKKAALAAIDPASEAKTVKDQYDSVIYKTKLAALNQPGVANRVAVSQLFGNAPDLVMRLTGTAPKLVDTLDQLNKAPGQVGIVPQITGTPEDKPTLEVLKKNTQLYNNGTAKDTNGTKQELSNSIRNYLKQLGKLQYEDGLDPKQLQSAVDYFSSPEYGKFARENKLSPSEIEPAKQVFQLHYLQPAVQTIGESLEGIVTTRSEYVKDPGSNSPRLVLKDEKLDMDKLQTTFDGTSVSFNLPDYSTNQAMTSAQRKALNDLNKTSKAVNKLISLGANLEGKEPAKYWEEKKYEILPKLFPVRPGTIINGYKYNGQGSWKDKANYTKVGDNNE
jgi:hypothetical protein